MGLLTVTEGPACTPRRNVCRAVGGFETPAVVPVPRDLALAPSAISPGAGETESVSIVPDDVARVVWVFQPWGGRPFTVRPKVHDDLAVAGAVSGADPLRSATWYDARGHVVATFSDADWLDRQNNSFEARVTAALNASDRQTISAVLERDICINVCPSAPASLPAGSLRISQPRSSSPAPTDSGPTRTA